MKNKMNLSAIAGTVVDQMQNLQDLSFRISSLENQLSKMAYTLSKYRLDLERVPAAPAKKTPSIVKFRQPEYTGTGGTSNIIPFPGTRRQKTEKSPAPFLGKPGKPLPPQLTDFRPVLQRHGLILLGWDKRISELGERYTAYWVTSTGTARFYASKPLSRQDFSSACPDHKSYAAEDGIEFYGQEAPVYIVHVAPELMMHNPRHGELRLPHINILKNQGSTMDFAYKFLLSREKALKKNRRKTLKKNTQSTSDKPLMAQI